jgi:hypothetical protein
MLIHKASGKELYSPLLYFYTITYLCHDLELEAMPEHYREPVVCLAAMTHEERWAILHGRAHPHASDQ